MLHVTEIFRHGKSGLGYTHTCSGGLVHLSEHQRGLVNNARLLHFRPEVIAFTGTLSDTCKNGIAAVLGRNIGNQLLDKNRLTDTGAAEQTDFTALCIGG